MCLVVRLSLRCDSSLTAGKALRISVLTEAREQRTAILEDVPLDTSSAKSVRSRSTPMVAAVISVLLAGVGTLPCLGGSPTLMACWSMWHQVSGGLESFSRYLGHILGGRGAR